MIWAVFALPYEAKGFSLETSGVEVKILGCCGRRALGVFEGMFAAADMKPDKVLLLGLAGGLSPELGVGDLVLQVGDFEESFFNPSLRRGRILSSDRLVPSVEWKASLWNEHRADCVDLETNHLGSFCQSAGVRFAALKAISDDFQTDLPVDPDLLVCPETSKPAPLRLLCYLCRNPRKFPGFLGMVHSAGIARQRLHEVAYTCLK